MAETKMEVEASLVCPMCRGIPYRIYRRQVAQGSDVFVNDLRSGPDGEIDVPDDKTDLRCPNCDVALIRT